MSSTLTSLYPDDPHDREGRERPAARVQGAHGANPETEPNPVYAEMMMFVTSSLGNVTKKLHKKLSRVGRQKKKVVAAHHLARHTGGRQRQAAQASLMARRRQAAHEPIGGIDHGRRMSRWVAQSVTAASVVLLWLVDSTLLTVLLLPMITTRMLTLVIVMASAASAHVSGKIHRREKDCDVPELELSPRERFLGRACAVLGLTIELALGVLRTVKTGSLITAVMLVAAGLALWAAIFWVAYRSHSDLADDLDRADRAFDKGTRHATADIAATDKALTRYWTERDDLRHFAAAAVARCLSHIEKARGLWGREHPGRPVPVFDEPPVLAEWRRFANGEVPAAYELGTLTTPVLHVPDQVTTIAPGLPGRPSGEDA